jgi:tetratricopeptide (TPR) repeat protein
MSIRYTALTLSLLTIFAQPAHAADNQVVSTLIDQGKYWQTRSRSDLAIDAWQKLLRLDAAQPDALYGMGLAALDKNNGEAAYGWLAKLKAVQPKHPLAALLDSAIATRTGGQTQIDTTRKLVQGGKNEEAVERYREMFGDKPPSGEIALEYYQALGATAKGWDEARKGLTRLDRENPDEARYALALAQHLSYREASRVDAIARLAQLMRRPETAKPATDAWRQALIWFNPRKSDRVLYDNYLAQHKDDAEVSAKLQRLLEVPDGTGTATLQTGIDVQKGFAALNNGELDAAAQKFEQVLKNNRAESGAIGGLGVIRLRQQRFGEAQALLERASKTGKSEQWRSALRSATYWSCLQKANVARKSGDLLQAQKLIEQAIALDAQTPSANIALAEVRGDLKQYELAEKLLRDVLTRDPQQTVAIGAYVELLAKQEKFDQVLQLLERLTPQQSEKLGGVARIQAESLRKLAASRQARDDLAGARTALEDALSLDPANVWIRLDLGRLYLRLELVNEARSMTDSLLSGGPGYPDALYAAALLYEESREWSSSLQTLEQVPAVARTPAMTLLLQRVQLQAHILRAVGLARQGQTLQATALLREAEQGSDRSDEQVGTLAGAYSEIGDAPRALTMMRLALSKGGKNNVALLQQYAQILLNTRQDAEFATVLRQLQSRKLTPQEARSYADLRVGYLLRQADLVREGGDLAAAYDVLAPLLIERPDDTRVLAALARMYGAAGESAQALPLYARALSRKPNDLELLLSAQSMAIDAKAYGEAQGYGERATALDAGNPRVLTNWARLYRAQGKNSKAEEFYRAALAAEGQMRDGALANAPVTGSNPFRPRVEGAMLPVAGFSPGLLPETVARNVPATYVLPALPGASAMIPTTYQAGVVPVGRRSNDVLLLPSSLPLAGLADGAPSALPYVSQVLPVPAFANRIATAEGVRPVPVLTLRQEAAEFTQQRSSRIDGQVDVRMHSGDKGLNQLIDEQSTVRGVVAVGDGRLAVSVTPVLLDAGKLSPDYAVASRFGAGPVAALANKSSTDSGVKAQAASGVGLMLSYEMKHWVADIGTTPIGFKHTNVVGGLQFRQQLTDKAKIGLSVSHRAVTESLLSFAGTSDERTGDSWGGVSATGLRVDLGWDVPGFGLYSYGQVQRLQGHQVASNSAVQAGAGVYLDLVKDSGKTISSGLSTTVMAYNKNLSGMTYGNGGYFSPQSFFALTVPLGVAGTSGRLGYQLQTNLGLQHFRQDDAAYFPTSAGRQASANVAAASAFALNSSNPATAVVAGSSRNALAYSFAGAMEYQLSPQLKLGGSMGLDNGRDYQELKVGVYMRLALDAINNARSTVPLLSRSPYDTNIIWRGEQQ